MNENNLNKKGPFWGKQHSKKTREKMRLSHLGQFKGDKHPNWKGGIKRCCGYVCIWKPGHPKADSKGYVKRGRLVAEKALGRHLKKGEMVHHINENRSDDRSENLLVCLKGYHKSLHHRMRKEFGMEGVT